MSILCFAREPREALRVIREQRRQDSDRDVAIECGVLRAIHLAHAARADRAEDFVRADMRAGLETHGLEAW